MVSRRWLVSVVSLWLPLLMAGAAGAAEDQPALAWQAPAGCPGVEAVRAELGRVLPREEVPKGLVVDALVIPVVAGFRLKLTLSGALEGERTLEAARCEHLPRAAALLVALSVRQALLVDKLTPPPKPAPKPRVVPKPATEPEAPVPWHLGVGAFGTSEMGMLPGVGLGGGIALELGADWIRLDLRPWYLAPTRATLASGGGVELQAAGIAAGACLPFLSGAVALWGCGELGAAALFGKGKGTDADASVSAVAARLDASLELRVAASEPISPWLRLGPWLALPTPRFVVMDRGEVWRVSSVGGSLTLGVSWRG